MCKVRGIWQRKNLTYVPALPVAIIAISSGSVSVVVAAKYNYNSCLPTLWKKISSLQWCDPPLPQTVLAPLFSSIQRFSHMFVFCLFAFILFFWGGGRVNNKKKKQIRKHPPVPRPLNLTLENSVRCASVLKDQPPSVERHRCKVGRNPHTDALFMID